MARRSSERERREECVPSWAKSSSAPATHMVLPVDTWPGPKSLRVRWVKGAAGVHKMAWPARWASHLRDRHGRRRAVDPLAKGWRITSSSGASDHVNAVRESGLRGRVADHASLEWSELLGEDARGPLGTRMDAVDERVGPYRCSSAALLGVQVDEQCVCRMWTSPPPDTWAGSDLRK